LQHFTGSEDVDYSPEDGVVTSGGGGGASGRVAAEQNQYDYQGAGNNNNNYNSSSYSNRVEHNLRDREVVQVPNAATWQGPAPLDAYRDALHTTNALQNTAIAAGTTVGGAGGKGDASSRNPNFQTPAVARPDLQDPYTKNHPDDPFLQEELRGLQHPSLYFTRHQFPAIFLEHERKKIFEIVLPEMYVTDFAASVRDTESYWLATEQKLKMVETQLKIQSHMLQRLLSSQQQQQQQSTNQSGRPPKR
jgi:hypothetical protein